MIICGIELAASEARLVLLKGEKSDFTHIDVEPRKLVLTNDEDPGEVKAFHNSLFAFFRENSVSLVAIKKEVKKGTMQVALLASNWKALLNCMITAL
jgi:hypothetical protein